MVNLEIKKNLWVGLKLLIVTLVAGVISAVVRSMLFAIGIVTESQTVWIITFLIGIPIGLYFAGLIARKWMRWN